MSNRFKPIIEFHGPAATHNMPCSVLHHIPEPAVFDCSQGYFKPSWKAQKLGYRTVYANTWFKRLALKLAFGENVSAPHETAQTNEQNN